MRNIAVWVLSLCVLVSPVAYAGGPGGGDSGGSSAGTTANSGGTPAATTQPSTAPVSAAPSSAVLQDEIDQMRILVQSQSEQIQKQQEELAEMKAKLGRDSSNSAQPAPSSSISAAAPASAPAAMAMAITPPPPAATAAATPTAKSSATLAADTGAPQHSPLFFRIGDATFSPLGFLDLTDVFRTEGTGNGIGTTFGSAPYINSLPVSGLTENRFSAQNSRIGVRIDAPVGGGTVTGYIEADFLGITAANANITSNSNSLRMRNYFADYRRGKFEFLAGQDWSMLTPNRKGLSPYPSDIFFSQDMDTNYQVGLTWARQPQVRFIYHPSDSWAMGISFENADQLVGSAVVQPANFSSVAGAVDTTSGGTLSTPPTPNVMPDIIAKVATDQKVNGNNWHFDFAGLFSEFKLVTSGSVLGSTSRATATSPGGGVEANLNLELVKNFHWIGTAYWSDGGGRYIFGIGPDLVIKEVTATSPLLPVGLKAGSSITGFEWQATPKSFLYGYYGGAYYGRSFYQDPTSTTTKLVGYGEPGTALSASQPQNRSVQEGTIGWVQTLFKNPNYGAISVITQGSYLTRDPWFVPTGSAHDAHLFMVYVDLRYTLP